MRALVENFVGKEGTGGIVDSEDKREVQHGLDGVCQSTKGVLYTPPHTPVGLHLEYNQICIFLDHPAGVHVESA